MSKRHQASRRRAYGRRQHEMHERREPPWGEPEAERPVVEDAFGRVEAAVPELRARPFGTTWVGLE